MLRQRVLAAQRLIEERADLSMEDVAGLVGFGSAALLRQHFVRELGTAPSSYRQAFTRRAG
ncbi:hypothetical protein Sya03_31840 [Spirilliplanes yamanashiensis]|uniref:HTH araC/xylS-type domain-containing protein n=1 Tax=Spirilliplanes yamanashiensis TaxID=42233 RepID=A0A8J3Y9F9_9ACTN|nr:hypothetical protein Sya03_31840 [Spirilliplanes yamanashiensis]